MAFLSEIASELVASGIALVLAWVATRYLRPWLWELTWRGTKVSGKWLSYDDDPAGAKPVGDATIDQRGSRVTMHLVRHTNRNGEPTHREFRYQGRFSARNMTLLFEASDRPDFILGAIVVHLDNAAKQFCGSAVYHDETKATVVSMPFWLHRVA